MKSSAITIAVALLAAASAYAGPIDGIWSGESQMRNGPQMLTFDIKASGGKLIGTLKQADNPATPIEDGKAEGSKFWFDRGMEIQGRHVTFKWTGEVKGEELLVTSEV